MLTLDIGPRHPQGQLVCGTEQAHPTQRGGGVVLEKGREVVRSSGQKSEESGEERGEKGGGGEERKE
eukprot:616752-Amorphochlora_amoeboformis.AAC.1